MYEILFNHVPVTSRNYIGHREQYCFILNPKIESKLIIANKLVRIKSNIINFCTYIKKEFLGFWLKV